MSTGIRLDAKEVQRGRAKISPKELDAQLDWHRNVRGLDIPRSGLKITKIARWAKAIQDYTTEVEERLAVIPVLGGYRAGEDLDSAMSVDGTLTSFMDVDWDSIV